MKYPLQGIIPPMVTPLKGNDTLDIEGLERLIEHILSGGVHGLFILGTTGEAPNLSYHLRRELVRQTCIQVAGRVPVLVGVSDTSATESILLARESAESGADAVVVAPPYYFKLRQTELIEYYNDLANRLPLPFFLYNVPSLTKVYIGPETVNKIAKNKRVLGLKDSSGDTVYFQTLVHAMKDRPDFPLLVGPDVITAETLLLGGHGGVNGGANLFPHLYVEMYKTAVNKDVERLEPMQQKIRQIWSALYYLINSDSCHLTGIKCALSIMGICSDFVASPFRKLNEAERALAKKNLEELDYINLK
jgi:4-hydroxy-tetrahydrodipicolinate synthase